MLSNIEIGRRIKERREELGLYQRDIAEKVQINTSTVMHYEKGEIARPKMAVLESIAKALRLNPTWLVEDYGERESSEVVGLQAAPDTVKVPMLGFIACGSPILAVEEADEYVDMPKNIRADFALECKGDSMIDDDILDGDIVYIRQQDMVQPGQIGAVLIGDEVTLKRVYFDEAHGILTLQAANAKYPPMIYTADELEQVKILGLAIGFTRSLI